MQQARTPATQSAPTTSRVRPPEPRAPGRRGYDAIVLGGGHNGLVCACYLARAGRKVCVVERRSVLGGAATTEELWPGFRVSTAAYVISLFQTDILRELRLRENGLQILPRRPSSFTPLPDGRSLLLGPDPELCRREIGALSPRDAEAYPRYESLLERVAAALEPALAAAAPDPLPLPASWRRIGVAKRFRDAGRLWRLYRALARLGSDQPAAVELLTGPARPILERWFESDALRATLATDALIGAFLSPSSPGSAYVLLHHVMGEAGGARGVWGYVRGGMGGLSDALARVAEQLGVEIVRDAPVCSINTVGPAPGARATGVTLEDGTTLDARVVASSADAHVTFERLIEPAAMPSEFREAVAKIDYSSASMKVNLALSEPPRFTARPSAPGEVAPWHHGTMHLSPTMEYLETAYDEARRGRPASEPIVEMTMATSVDDTIAPEGKHIIGCFVQFAPYEVALADGGERSAAHWDALRESYADRIVAKIAEYAPNVPGAILHRQVLTPLDLERVYGLTGGNIMQGAMNANQLYCFRPVAGWADHRTPIRGLYLCGAASHPGGGVMGACGRNAAVEILRDRA